MCKPNMPQIAVVVGTDAKGDKIPIRSAVGAAAAEIVEQAQATGVEVQRDPDFVGELLRKQGEGTGIPLAIYELMAEVINFAQELNDNRATSGGLVPDSGQLASGIEQRLDDDLELSSD